MKIKKRLIQTGFLLHRTVIWVALLALVLFAVSGFLHVLLTWTGPQSNVHRAPQQTFSVAHLQGVAPILERLEQEGVSEAEVVKLVPSPQGPLLQVTTDTMAPRRYFDPTTGAELRGYDEQLARWLASHYLPDSDRTLDEVTFQTDYSSEYPWVNRLLPVYRLRFSGDDGLTLFVHTETMALANISDNWKRRVQWLFRNLHTFAWLEEVRHLRVLLLALLLTCLLGMLGSGLVLLHTVKRKGGLTPARRGHRILAHTVSIPLLGFAASGFYHLLHSEYFTPQRDFNIAQPLSLSQSLDFDAAALELPEQPLQGVNLLSVAGELYFRASLAPADNTADDQQHGDHHHGGRQQRFDGIARERGGRYFSTAGRSDELTDEQVARHLAMDYLGLTPEQVLATEEITRFDQGYDFRNKRLPVWQVAVDHQPWDRLFIDVASGLLVDRNSPGGRLEGYSFSYLHKWSFLSHPLGREKRDALLALFLGLSLTLAGLGVWLRSTRWRTGA